VQVVEPANEAIELEPAAPELPWVDVSAEYHEEIVGELSVVDDTAPIHEAIPSAADVHRVPKGLDVLKYEKGIASAEDDGGIPSEVLQRLGSAEAAEREAALGELAVIGGDDAFRCISRAFDDPSEEVRNAAAEALYALQADRAATFTRALREGTPERRRKIGQALASSGLAANAVGNLTGESREKTYDAFSLLFLMAKAGEVKPLMQAIEEYPNIEVRIAVVKLLALSGQPEIVPAFRRLAVRGSMPSEVRSAVMEAIYQISSQARENASSAA
jgi:HEAT repeat protein